MNTDKESIEKDISFLLEMKSRLIEYQNSKDTTQLEMVFTMIDDWIIELKNIG